MKSLCSVAVACVLLAPGVYLNKVKAQGPGNRDLPRQQPQILQNSMEMIANGRQTFRFDTFGDEAFWGGALQLHKTIEGQALGGVGPGVSPTTATHPRFVLPRLSRHQSSN